MKILVINAGSSTLKFQLLDMEKNLVIAKGNVEKINQEGTFIGYKAKDKEIKEIFHKLDHKQAMKTVIEKLTDREVGVVNSIDEIDGFGHRIVNVGENYFDPVIVTKEILDDFKANADFSPLHTPGAIEGICEVFRLSPKSLNVAVFDTGFHKTLPAYAYMYAIPKRYYENYKIRRYGAHGTSHYYVSKRCAELMNQDIKNIKMITCHIGSGASISAVQGGKCIDTSMGFTPLEGIMMNTRSGDIDPAVIEFICKKENKTVSEVLDILNKESGFQGLIEDTDMRIITAKLDQKEVKAAFDMYCYRIKKYIGAYAASLNGVDAIVFTAGCGENTPILRQEICEGLTYLGVEIDKEKNYGMIKGEETLISSKNSKVKIYVIPTDEELVIAQETMKFVSK